MATVLPSRSAIAGDLRRRRRATRPRRSRRRSTARGTRCRSKTREAGLLPTRPMSTRAGDDRLVDVAARGEQLPFDRDVGAERLLEPALVLHDQVAVGDLLVARCGSCREPRRCAGVGRAVGRSVGGRCRPVRRPWSRLGAGASVAVGASVADGRRRRCRTRRSARAATTVRRRGAAFDWGISCCSRPLVGVLDGMVGPEWPRQAWPFQGTSARSPSWISWSSRRP